VKNGKSMKSAQDKDKYQHNVLCENRVKKRSSVIQKKDLYLFTTWLTLMGKCAAFVSQSDSSS